MAHGITDARGEKVSHFSFVGIVRRARLVHDVGRATQPSGQRNGGGCTAAYRDWPCRYRQRYPDRFASLLPRGDPYSGTAGTNLSKGTNNLFVGEVLQVDMKIGLSGPAAIRAEPSFGNCCSVPSGTRSWLSRARPKPSAHRLWDDWGTTTDPKSLRRPMRVSIVHLLLQPSMRNLESAGHRTSPPSTRP